MYRRDIIILRILNNNSHSVNSLPINLDNIKALNRFAMIIVTA